MRDRSVFASLPLGDVNRLLQFARGKSQGTLNYIERAHTKDLSRCVPDNATPVNRDLQSNATTLLEFIVCL